MTNLLQQMSQLGLSPQQIEKTFFTVDEWLENEYPVMSQMYKNQLLQPILNANKQPTIFSIQNKVKAA
jgi:hypothetical protein